MAAGNTTASAIAGGCGNGDDYRYDAKRENIII
jgi:hypothetical protein